MTDLPGFETIVEEQKRAILDDETSRFNAQERIRTNEEERQRGLQLALHAADLLIRHGAPLELELVEEDHRYTRKVRLFSDKVQTHTTSTPLGTGWVLNAYMGPYFDSSTPVTMSGSMLTARGQLKSFNVNGLDLSMLKVARRQGSLLRGVTHNTRVHDAFPPNMLAGSYKASQALIVRSLLERGIVR